MEERLQKRIAASGLASRRKAEELILSGRVKVNGEIVSVLGTKVKNSDFILVDNKPLPTLTKAYYVINKPRGVICTVDDPKKRRTILDILPEEALNQHVYPVGRLDSDTKGVLLLTNDGDFMNHMVGPRSGIEKEYLARVHGIITFNDIKKLSEGVIIDSKKTLPAIVSLESVDEKNNSSLVRITITQGLYHQIKKMFISVGHEVKKLTRVRFGHITIDNLREGELYKLPIKDVKILYELSLKDKELKI